MTCTLLLLMLAPVPHGDPYFLSPKLEQLQTGKISGLSYEGVISIALRLSPPSSNCSELHQMIQSTALLICNREEKIP